MKRIHTPHDGIELGFYRRLFIEIHSTRVFTCSTSVHSLKNIGVMIWIEGKFEIYLFLRTLWANLWFSTKFRYFFQRTLISVRLSMCTLKLTSCALFILRIGVHAHVFSFLSLLSKNSNKASVLVISLTFFGDLIKQPRT